MIPRPGLPRVRSCAANPCGLFKLIAPLSKLRRQQQKEIRARSAPMALGGGGGGVSFFFLFVFFFLLAVAEDESRAAKPVPASFSRRSFPPDFTFGASSSAYQIEGAAREGGRGPSIWDAFTHNHPDKIADRSNSDLGIDSYHLYKEDVKLLKSMGMDAYRFSISWSRILPNGSLSGGINKVGVQYYNNLINEILSQGLKPYVTLFHWDLPQDLEDQYGGFRSPRIVDDFRNYAEICFKEFGDRVKHWITENEPWSFAQGGYAAGTFAPGRCSPFEEGKCSQGDSSREPYLVAHHLILAHAEAVKLYRDNYKPTQKGMIGITLLTHWFIPYSKSKADGDAMQRAIDFMFGWFMDPLTQGDYPFIMRAIVHDRLPRFTQQQSEMVKGSLDFIGLNYYITIYARSMPFLSKANVSYDSDIHAFETGQRHGVLLGPSVPKGLRDLLVYVKNKYNNPIIYITENGVDEKYNATLPLKQALKDDVRVDYHRRHLMFLQMAIRDGVDVRGYFVWSLCDVFEWAAGYSVRFGLSYVDHKNNFKRYPKSSALWFKKFLKG